eukprot:4899092-Karenia_brevis.AAC.1
METLYPVLDMHELCYPMDDHFPHDNRTDTFAKNLAVHRDINNIFVDLGATPVPPGVNIDYCMVPHGFELDARENIREDDLYRLLEATHNVAKQEILSAHKGAFLPTHPDRALARIRSKGLE